MVLDKYVGTKFILVLTKEEVIKYDLNEKEIIERTEVTITNKNDFRTFCIDSEREDTLFFEDLNLDMNEIKRLFKKGAK